jgi:hypothetical protein
MEAEMVAPMFMRRDSHTRGAAASSAMVTPEWPQHGLQPRDALAGGPRETRA